MSNIDKIWHIVVLAIIILFATLMLLAMTKVNRENQNKYQCAVYGYQPDCSTPLAPEDKLK